MIDIQRMYVYAISTLMSIHLNLNLQNLRVFKWFKKCIQRLDLVWKKTYLVSHTLIFYCNNLWLSSINLWTTSASLLTFLSNIGKVCTNPHMWINTLGLHHCHWSNVHNFVKSLIDFGPSVYIMLLSCEIIEVDFICITFTKLQSSIPTVWVWPRSNLPQFCTTTRCMYVGTEKLQRPIDLWIGGQKTCEKNLG